MENLELGKLILKQVEAEPKSLRMTMWGARNTCGTSACLAGHAMLLSGYTLTAANVFRRPDGSRVMDNATEAYNLLGLTKREYQTTGHPGGLFYIMDNKRALQQFRQIVETEEACRAAAEG